MKKLLIVLLAVLAFACKKEDEPERFMLDPTAMVKIKPGAVAKSDNPAHLTPLEIVKKATTLRYYNDYLSSGPNRSDCAAPIHGKDTISDVPAMLFYGTGVINEDGFGKPYLVYDYIGMEDCVVEIFRSNHDIDTIAYIPNEVARLAKAEIEAALAAQDTTAVYRVFNDAFKFIPITGEEYRELKRQNLH